MALITIHDAKGDELWFGFAAGYSPFWIVGFGGETI